jgi:uncharacterized membrane protein
MMAAVIMSALASAYAAFQPNKYDVHIRGENILPPSKSLLTLVGLIIIGGLPAIYAFGFTNLTVLTIVTLISLIAMVVSISLISRRLKAGLVVNEIIAKTN